MVLIVKPILDAYAFTYTQADTNETYTVDVEMVRDEDKEFWDEFANSRLLNYYVGPFATPHVKCHLLKMKVFYLTFVEEAVDGAFVEVTVVNKSAEDGVPTQHTTPLFLRCPIAAVLIVLRTHTQETDGTLRPREFVVMVQENRRNISQGYRDVPEIPYGRFDANRHVRGPLVKIVEDLCNIQLLDADFTRLNGRRGVSSMPGCSLDNVELYLFRQNVTEEAMNELRRQTENTPDTPGTITVKIVPLGQAWQVTNDLKTLGAIFYFHELRYLNRMPRYAPPSGGRRPTQTRPAQPVAPTWTTVAALEPTSQSFNLVVKVHEPLKLIPETREGRSRRTGLVVVGDATGIVTMVVTEKQIETPGLDAEGTIIVLRNAAVDMSSNHVRVYVSRQWGDLVTDLSNQEGLPSTDFDVNTTNDISEVKYEAVFDRGDSSGSQRSRPLQPTQTTQPTSPAPRVRRAGMTGTLRRTNPSFRRVARGRGGSSLMRASRPVAANA